MATFLDDPEKDNGLQMRSFGKETDRQTDRKEEAGRLRSQLTWFSEQEAACSWPRPVSGAEDITVTEMQKELPTESTNEIATWVQCRFRGECDSPPSWKTVHLVSLRKPDASAEYRIRGNRPSHSCQKMAKRYFSVFVRMLNGDGSTWEPKEW